jgi:hypothetical protein
MPFCIVCEGPGVVIRCWRSGVPFLCGEGRTRPAPRGEMWPVLGFEAWVWNAASCALSKLETGQQSRNTTGTDRKTATAPDASTSVT